MSLPNHELQIAEYRHMTSQRIAGRRYLYKACWRKGAADRRGVIEVNAMLCPSALQGAMKIGRWLAFQLVLVHTNISFVMDRNWYWETVIPRAAVRAWPSTG